MVFVQWQVCSVGLHSSPAFSLRRHCWQMVLAQQWWGARAFRPHDELDFDEARKCSIRRCALEEERGMFAP